MNVELGQFVHYLDDNGNCLEAHVSDVTDDLPMIHIPEQRPGQKCPCCDGLLIQPECYVQGPHDPMCVSQWTYHTIAECPKKTAS